MSVLQNILAAAKKTDTTIVLPEGDDPRVIEAASRAVAGKIARVALIGGPDGPAAKLARDVSGVSHIEPETSDLRADLIAALVEARAHKGMTPDRASDEINNPLVFADLMVRQSLAHGAVAGAVFATGDVVRHAIQLIGIAPDAGLVSSFFVMELPSGETYVYSDCGLVIDPTEEELAKIASASADNFAALVGDEPRVAMLSFSTKGSARHPKVSKMQHATQLAQNLRPDLAIDGELQFDSAIIPSIAERKVGDSDVAGKANVFVFPDLNTGNIAYKITERLAGATAIGPILQGLNKPANDLSRGCSADDIYYMIALTAVQAQT